ncbi:MAG TPA: TIGR03790 family protein [Verrucomicrobiae bacterium]|nr:TIGR03790 family protein [Verrucomicrobiae bacterium]
MPRSPKPPCSVVKQLRNGIAFLLIFSSLAACAQAGNATKRSPDQVLLVVNTNSPISLAIAADYAQKRQVRNVLSIQCQDSALNTKNETIPLGTYTQLIENPIRDYLALHTNIDFIVLTKGVPIRIHGSSMGSCDEHSHEPAATRGHPSVDSTLAALGYADLPGTMKIDITGSGAIGCAYSNRYWNATVPFSHRQFGGYLVTRLDGYTQTDAEALVTKALAAEQGLTNGSVLLDVQPIFGLGNKTTQPAPITGTTILRESPWNEYNADMQHAHDLLAQRGIADELDLSETFVGGRSNLLGYFSWGSNDARYSAAAYQTLFFAPGSLSDTAVSTCARTFLPTKGGQSLLVDLIAHGLTCGKGYVDEPLLQANASPTIVLDRYTSGYNMAESFYAASHFVGWEDVIIGDPLCSPYAK